MEFQNGYEITFPQFSGDRPAAPDGKRAITYIVTLTTPELSASERERLAVSYSERLAWIEQEIHDIAQMPVADRMTWRCHLLARLHLHQECFALEHLGLMLLANDMQLRKEYTHLHELVEAAMQLPPVPDMDVYYQLPDFLPTLAPAAESQPPGQARDFMLGREIYEQLRRLKREFRMRQRYIVRFKAVLGAAYKLLSHVIHEKER